MRLIGAGQQLESALSVIRGERPHGELLAELDRVHKALLGTEGAELPDLAGRQEEHDEERVEDRGRRLEEVVVVARHELPDLVHERAEPRATDDGCDQARGEREVEEQQDDRDEHAEPAPEHVRDVQPAAA